MSAASNSVPRLLRENLPPVELRDLPKPPSLALLVGPGVIMLATSLGSGSGEIYFWPGWSTGGATALSWVFGGRPEVISAVSLLAIGVGLSGTRVVYRTVERVQMVLAACIFVAIGWVAVLVIRWPTLQAFGEGLVTIPTALPTDLDITTLLAALAFCGAGGSINLATSHWVRDKGFGMGHRVPKVTSPWTGEVVSVASAGFFFEPSPKNLECWAAWWRLMRREQRLGTLGSPTQHSSAPGPLTRQAAGSVRTAAPVPRLGRSVSPDLRPA